jgi:hypothetical protein
VTYLDPVLVAAAIIVLTTWIVRRLRRGGPPDTTITFGHAAPEPVLDDLPPAELGEDHRGDNARAVVPELIDVLTDMQMNLDGLDAIDYRSLAHHGDGVSSSMRQLATQTFGRIRHLDQATVPLLPDDLSKAWHSLLQLLDDLRRYGRGSSEPWSDILLSRNRRDVIDYLVVVRTALFEFAKSSHVAEYCEPPDLRRSE